MMHKHAGEWFIAAGAALWGLFPVMTIASLASLPPLSSLAWTTAFAAIFFAIVVSVRGAWRELADTRARPDILLTTLILGVLFYVFQFTGLTFTSAGNASMLALTELFFSYLLFNVWHKEHFPGTHVVGALCMLFGAAVVLYPNTASFNAGDLLIVLGAAVAPMGNFFQRRARTRVSSESIMFVRSALSAVLLLALAGIFGQHPLRIPNAATLSILAVNGILLMGVSKIFWIEGIHRISVTKANALSSITPLFTLLFAFLILGNVPTVWQLTAFAPMFLGALLLGKRPREARMIR